MQTIDTKNATAAANSNRMIISDVMLAFVLVAYPKKSKISNIDAPSIAGIAAKNENSVAKSRLTPSMRAPSIVAPEREVPGMSAND